MNTIKQYLSNFKKQLVIALFLLTITSTAQQTCRDFLNDLIPRPNDSTLEVRVHFYVLKPYNGASGIWGNNTINDAIYVLWSINSSIYKNMIPCGNPVHDNISGALITDTTVHDTKLKLVLSGFDMIEDYNAYYNMETDGYTNYNDSTSINIYFGSYPLPPTSPGIIGPHTNPNAYNNPIYFPSGVGSISGECLRIAHEIGHVLGLTENYTVSPFPMSSIDVLSGSCCSSNKIYTNDLYQELYTWNNADSCTSPYIHHNNLMGSNPCMRYLSPQQLAIMHYHLRTDCRRWLTPQSYQNLDANHSFDLSVDANTGNQTWTVDRYMKGDIYVRSGYKLTIQSIVAMTQKARIIVEPGAQLIVEGNGNCGKKITNISGQLWHGIDVAGDASKNQSYNSSTGFAMYQGMLWLKNGATLEHSTNSVQNFMHNAQGIPIWNTTGGIIIANGAKFLNNLRDAEFLQYTTAPSVSRFINCTFDTPGLIGRDPWLQEVAPHVHVSMWATTGIQFKGCKFDFSGNTMSQYNGIDNNSINSIDASYTVDKYGSTSCTFKNFSQGILVQNANPLKVVNVYNSIFDNNKWDAVYFENVTNAVLDNNLVSIPSYGNGFYFNSSQGYNARNNTFIDSTNLYQQTSGITPYNSAGGFFHQSYRNTFKGLQVGIKPVDNNSGVNNNADGLKMNCNVFASGNESNLFDIALLPGAGQRPTVMTYQGTPNSNNPKDCVRNIYGATSNGCSNCEVQWLIVDLNGTSAKPYVHPSNVESYTQPLPQPEFSNLQVIIQSTPHHLDYPNHCPATTSNAGNNSQSMAVQLESLHNYLNEIRDYKYAPKEWQLTQLSILNLFLADTVESSRDSAFALLKDNRAHIDNADILTVFAAMNMNNFDLANSLANGLGDNRSAWKTLLAKLIYLQQHPEITYKLSEYSEHKDALMEYIITDSLAGFGSALALLRGFGGLEYEDPRPVPPIYGEGSRMAAPQQTTSITTATSINVYPNPAGENVSIEYKNKKEKTLLVIMRDVLGRMVYEGEVKSNTILQIPLNNMRGGVYLLNAYDNNTSVYQTKVIGIK